MIDQKYIARCYPVYQHERNENASFLSIFNGGGRPKWRFSNFPRFWKNSSALGSFNCIFENNSLKALFGQNMKKLKILKLSPDSRYLQKLALNFLKQRKLIFNFFVNRNWKKLANSRKRAKILPDNCKCHHPIETLSYKIYLILLRHPPSPCTTGGYEFACTSEG